MAEVFVYGVHAVMALLNNPHRNTKQLYINQDREDKRLQRLLDLAIARQVPVEQVSLQSMNQRFSNCVHQGVVAKASPIPEYTERDLVSLLQGLPHPAFVLCLDGVTDPHNLGACLRSADAVGVDFVLIPKDKSASITPVVAKVASGATESVPLVRVTNLVRAMETLKEQGLWLFGASAEAPQSLYQIDLKTPLALVLGSEGKGLRRLTREHCDHLFSLPMLGTVESLNVSVATAVSLYEVLRQRS